MKSCYGKILFVTIMTVLFSGLMPVLAVSGKVGLEARSAYAWRGITRTDGVVVDPYVDVKMGGFTFGFWGNVNIEDLDKIDDQGVFSESDVSLSYEIDLDTAIVGLGYTEYQYSVDREDTREVFVSTRGPVFSDDLFAGVKVYYDIGVIDDFYATASLDYFFKIVDSLKGDVGGSVGYAGKNMSINHNGGFNDYSVFFGVNYAVDSNLEIGGKLMYIDSLDRAVLPDQPVDFLLCLNVAQKF